MKKRAGASQINTKKYWDKKHQDKTFPAVESYLLLLAFYIPFIKQYGWADPFKVGKQWLDFGCGNANQRFEINNFPKNLTYIGYDFSPEVIAYNKKQNKAFTNVQFIDSFAEQQTYELITAIHTFEHLDDPIAAWHKLWLMTKNYLIIQVPYKNSFDCPEHLWHFTETSFSEITPKPLILLSPSMNINNGNREIVFVWSKKQFLKKSIFLKPFEDNLSPFGWVSVYLNLGYVPYAYSWPKFILEKLIPLSSFAQTIKQLKKIKKYSINNS